ncbi:hypothetical protein F5880DRAFT_1505950 [Lentinula raphanica]|nr:hypothetical protein EV360DRAFT_35643 [Lentinula raphanica]KAJ3824778.1 hypothetical protein F5880DRAFT_1505950 [Lentinula raphanica]
MSSSSLWTPSSLTYVPPENPSPKVQTTLAFVEARNVWFSRVASASGVEQMMSLFDDNLEHRILPQSLGRPVLNKNQYREYVQGLLHYIRDYKLSIHEVIESNDDSITMHASSAGMSVSGARFTDEYIFILHFTSSDTTEELPKITSVKEFVDSKVTAEFFQEERRRAKLKEQGRHC